MSEVDIKFGIDSIFERTFSIRKIKPIDHKDLNLDLLKYGLEIKTSVFEKENKVRTVTTINAIYNDPDFFRKEEFKAFKEMPVEELMNVMILSVEMEFSVAPLSKMIKKKEGEEPILFPLLDRLIADTSISTVRGISYTRTEGSFLQRKPLPYLTIDVMK